MSDSAARGGPQRIPRPAVVGIGAPAPWAHLRPEDRVLTLAGLRDTFAGRVGVPSFVESDPVAAAHPSAVLAPFYEHGGDLYVVLTRRSWSLRAHTGEVSFPGGRRDNGDATLAAVALREAHEEIALDPSTVEVLGELDHLMTITSRSFIVPFVAILPGRPELTANDAEVDAVLHVPVAELLAADVYREERWQFSGRPPWLPPDSPFTDGGGARPIFFFEIVGDTIWGATAAMLRHLLGLALGLGVAIDHA